MAFKKRTVAEDIRGGKKLVGGAYMAFSGRSASSGAFSVVHARKRGRAVVPTETIEARLERKATEADGKVFATKSLGQMTYEERDNLLFGE